MSRYYPNENFEINVARGLVKGTSGVHKFGAVPSMSTSDTGTIWDISDTFYPWATWDAGPSLVTVDCADPAEVGGQVQIEGLDANYNTLIEIVDLTLQTGNSSINTFRRVSRVFYIDQTSLTNTGDIDVKVGLVTVAKITAGKGQTLMAVYTVPAGYTLFIKHFVCSTVGTDSCSGDVQFRFDGQSNFRIGHAFEVTGQYSYEFESLLVIPEKTDIDVRVEMIAGNNARITSAFDGTLIKNGLS
jgi:hypothetical protein